MKNKIVFILFLSFVSTVFSQEKIAEFSNPLKTSKFDDIKDIIPIVNKENGEIAIFLTDVQNVYGYQFNDQFKLTNKIKFDSKRRKYKKFIGSRISKNGDYTIYLMNKMKNKFIAINTSFKNKKTTSKEFTLLRDYETFLQAFTSNNKFYILSSSIDVNNLYLYTFNEEGTPKRNIIDFQDLKFFSKSGKNKKLLDILVSSQSLVKFTKDTPLSILSTLHKRKMYTSNNSVIFTFDNNKEFTQVFSINLDSFKTSVKKISKPLKEVKSSKKSTSSFLSNNFHFSIVVSTKQLILRITDFKKNTIVKEYVANIDEPISFKNGKIIREGDELYKIFLKQKASKERKRFFRAMRQGLSMYALYNKNNYYVTIGGIKHLTTHSYSRSPFSNSNISTTPFTSTMILKMESVFDTNFNHLKDVKSTNVFGDVKNFISPDKNVFTTSQFFLETKSSKPYSFLLKKIPKNISNSIFNYKNYYIYVEYNKGNNNYLFRKFSN